MSSIGWTDAIGAATLDNGKPFPGDRFANWTPRSVPHADSEWALGTRRLHVFEYAEEHSVAFDIPAIPRSSMDLMLRLQMHLRRGGLVTINSDDVGAINYNDCWLAVDSDVDIQLTDKTNLEYTLSTRLMGPARFASSFEGGTSGESPSSSPPGLIADWDPDALTGLVEDGSYTDTLPDTVGSFDATLENESQWPKFLEDTLNGYPVLEFTSLRGDYLETDLIGNPTLGTTQAFVFRRNGSTVEHGYIVKYNVPPADSAADANLSEQSADPGVLKFNGTADIGSPITDWSRVIIVVDSAVSVRAYFNGVLIDTFAPHTSLNEVKGIAFGAGPVAGGTGTANYQFARGQWYSSAFDEAAVTALDTELATQYGP